MIALQELHNLHAALHRLAPDGKLALAYSGGLDSRFLAYTLQQAGIDVVLLHVSGPHVPPRDTASAKTWAAAHHIPLREIPLNPLSQPTVANNERQRCYACKHLLFTRMKEEAGSLPLCDGSHTSDHLGYRPGLKALGELGIHSPLVDAGLDKTDIHRLALLTGLDNPDQRARPCLLTRLPYGFSPKPELLASIAHVEDMALTILEQVTDKAPDFRVRLVETDLDAPKRMELHITPSSCDLDALQQALCPYFSPPIRVVVMETLSGFFDRQQA